MTPDPKDAEWTPDARDALVAESKSDAGAPFRQLTALARLRCEDRAAFESLRGKMKALKVNVTTLDRCLDSEDQRQANEHLARVAAERQRAEAESRCARQTVASCSEPEPVIDLGALLDSLLAFVRRFVVVTPDQAIALALWTAHTHAIAAADTTPYLQITSATKRAGKTRLLEVLECIVARPWLTGRTSAAALVRKIDSSRPTLLLDESDAAFKGEKDYAEALRGILNTGYKRNGRSSLCVGKSSDISVRDFTTFSPKAIAGIGRLPDTVADRAIPIALRRRVTSEPVERWRDRDGREQAAPLSRQLEQWCSRAVETLRAARPKLPDQLNDRAQDVWEPLVAIADSAGGHWGEDARRSAGALMGVVEDTDIAVELLTDLREIVADADRSIFATRTIIERLTALEDRPWPTWRKGDKPITGHGLARLLKPFGIHPVGTEDKRGYPMDALRVAFARYLPFKPSKCQRPNNDGPESPDACDSGESHRSASVSQSGPVNIGALTHTQIESADGEDQALDAPGWEDDDVWTP